MKKFLVSFVALALAANVYAGSITIAVAANVSYAMEELKEKFQATHPEVKIQTILGSSGKLTAQIRNGAPYEVFMAANMAYPKALYKDEVAVTEPKIYARGGLALLSANGRDFTQGLSILTDEKIKKIAIANPKTAPYGTAAVEAMQNAGIYEKIKSKLVYGESISQTVAYAVGATDIGIVNGSAMHSDKMTKYKKGTHWALVDDSIYTPIDQGIVLLKYGAKNPEAKAFYDFILGSEAREILSRYGYLLP
jgi:molybdate transport system substrate-binding protein